MGDSFQDLVRGVPFTVRICWLHVKIKQGEQYLEEKGKDGVGRVTDKITEILFITLISWNDI
jgi:hypothetical protein